MNFISIICIIAIVISLTILSIYVYKKHKNKSDDDSMKLILEPVNDFSTATGQGQFTVPAEAIIEQAVIKNARIVNTSNNTVQINDGAVFENCTFVGNSTKLIMNTNSYVFNNTTFDGTFINSNIYATNFGCVNDMEEVSYNWYFSPNYGGETTYYVGTNNYDALNNLFESASYLAYSDIILNGDFYTEFSVDSGENDIIHLRNLHNIKIKGTSNSNRSNIVCGLRLYNCHNLDISYINILGYHGIHELPPLADSKYATEEYASSPSYLLSYYPYKQTHDLYGKPYSIAVYGNKVCGLKGLGIQFRENNTNNTIHHCHMQMRQGGIAAGYKPSSLDYSSVLELNQSIIGTYVHDCTFSHMYYQPLGSHSKYFIAYNIESHYVMQGIDFSTCANNSYVYNSSFYQCLCGWKQQSMIDSGEFGPYLPSYSYNNRLDNVYYEVSNKTYYDIVHKNSAWRNNAKYKNWTGMSQVDVTQILPFICQGRKDDKFYYTNSTLDINLAYIDLQESKGIQFRANNTYVENCYINYNWGHVPQNIRNTTIKSAKYATKSGKYNNISTRFYNVPITYNGKSIYLLANNVYDSGTMVMKDYDVMTMFCQGGDSLYITSGNYICDNPAYNSNYNNANVTIKNTYLNLTGRPYYYITPMASQEKLALNINIENSYVKKATSSNFGTIGGSTRYLVNNITDASLAYIPGSTSTIVEYSPIKVGSLTIDNPNIQFSSGDNKMLLGDWQNTFKSSDGRFKHSTQENNNDTLTIFYKDYGNGSSTIDGTSSSLTNYTLPSEFHVPAGTMYSYVKFTPAENGTKLIIDDPDEKVFHFCQFATSETKYFKNSEISFKNFGFVDDMEEIPMQWGFYGNHKGTSTNDNYEYSTTHNELIDTYLNHGTENGPYISSINQFMAYSNNLDVYCNGYFFAGSSGSSANEKVTINGTDYLYGRYYYIDITYADNMKFHGDKDRHAKLLPGMRIYDSHYIDVSYIDFLGWHKSHELPTFSAENGIIYYDDFYDQTDTSRWKYENNAYYWKYPSDPDKSQYWNRFYSSKLGTDSSRSSFNVSYLISYADISDASTNGIRIKRLCTNGPAGSSENGKTWWTNLYNSYSNRSPYKEYIELYGKPFSVVFSKGYKSMGVTDMALSVYTKNSDPLSNSPKIQSHHIDIHDCHVEMRSGGFSTGGKGQHFLMSYVNYYNNTFDHIFYQPIGWHSSYNVAYNNTSYYCLQALDISTGAGYCYVYNSEFYNNLIGFKCTNGQKQINAFDTKCNRIDNIYYEVTNKSYTDIVCGNTDPWKSGWSLFDSIQYLFLSDTTCPGEDGYLKLTNSTLNYNIAYKPASQNLTAMVCRAAYTEIRNTTLNTNWSWAEVTKNGTKQNIYMNSGNPVSLSYVNVNYKGKTVKLPMNYNTTGYPLSYDMYYLFALGNHIWVDAKTDADNPPYNTAYVKFYNSYINVGKHYSAFLQNNHGKMVWEFNNTYILNNNPALYNSSTKKYTHFDKIQGRNTNTGVITNYKLKSLTNITPCFDLLTDYYLYPGKINEYEVPNIQNSYTGINKINSIDLNFVHNGKRQYCKKYYTDMEVKYGAHNDTVTIYYGGHGHMLWTDAECDMLTVYTDMQGVTRWFYPTILVCTPYTKNSADLDEYFITYNDPNDNPDKGNYPLLRIPNDIMGNSFSTSMDIRAFLRNNNYEKWNAVIDYYWSVIGNSNGAYANNSTVTRAWVDSQLRAKCYIDDTSKTIKVSRGYFRYVYGMNDPDGSGTGHSDNIISIDGGITIKSFVHRRHPAKKSHWQHLINEYFKDGGILSNIDANVGKWKAILGNPPFKKHTIFLTLPMPCGPAHFIRNEELNWGEINGEQINFAKQDYINKNYPLLASDGAYRNQENTDARIKAIKWYVDETINQILNHDYENIEISGLYCIEETIWWNEDVFKLAADYISSKGLQYMWLPYATSAAWIPENYAAIDNNFNYKKYNIPLCCGQTGWTWKPEKTYQDFVNVYNNYRHFDLGLMYEFQYKMLNSESDCTSMLQRNVDLWKLFKDDTQFYSSNNLTTLHILDLEYLEWYYDAWHHLQIANISNIYKFNRTSHTNAEAEAFAATLLPWQYSTKNYTTGYTEAVPTNYEVENGKVYIYYANKAANGRITNTHMQQIAELYEDIAMAVYNRNIRFN